MSDKIDKILKDLDSLREEILEYQRELKETQNDWNENPIFPSPYNPGTPIIVNPDPRCSQCGLQLSPVMGYVCPQVNCPSGLGGPSCSQTGQPGHTALTTLNGEKTQ